MGLLGPRLLALLADDVKANWWPLRGRIHVRRSHDPFGDCSHCSSDSAPRPRRRRGRDVRMTRARCGCARASFRARALSKVTRAACRQDRHVRVTRRCARGWLGQRPYSLRGVPPPPNSGGALTLISALAGGVAGALAGHNYEANKTAVWSAVGVGLVFTIWGEAHLASGNDHLQQSIWFYNRDLPR